MVVAVEGESAAATAVCVVDVVGWRGGWWRVDRSQGERTRRVSEVPEGGRGSPFGSVGGEAG